jgi:D-apionolactonase
MKPILEFSKSLPIGTIYYGSPEKLPEQISLSAGKLSMIYENGALRTISIGKNEIVRMIYSAVRDKAWLTAEPEISDEEIDIREDSFQIRYTCRYRLDEIDFSANYSITGTSDHSVVFEMEGEALSTFEKNRIGFCMLHPVEECSGNPCFVTHSNNEEKNLVFPINICPYQPFKDIKSIRWEVAGCKCTVDFYGDIFEMEDQRNWTDASFKTYSTPLEKPFPVTMQKGEKVSQKIVLRVEANSFQASKSTEGIQIQLFPDQLKPLPTIGIGQSTRPQKMNPDEISVLKNLPFSHYRIEIYLFQDDWKIHAENAVEEAIQLGYPLMFALFLDEPYYLKSNQFIMWILGFSVKVESVILFHTTLQSIPDSLIDFIMPLFRLKLPGVKIGCGTNANFAQLNRNRPETDCADFISYSIHPQEHASDNQTLVENLKAQEYTVNSASGFAKGKEIWVSPVNIQRRFNANNENFEHPFDGEGSPPQLDARLMSLFGACWSAVSLKYLSESGVNGCTYFETVGERGLIQGENDSRWPSEFPSVGGMIFPIFHIFRHILANKEYKVMFSKSSDPLVVDSFVLTDGKNLKLLIVNFTSEIQEVQIPCIERNAMKKVLDAESFPFAASNSEWLENEPGIKITHVNPITLSPFSISFIDGCD